MPYFVQDFMIILQKVVSALYYPNRHEICYNHTVVSSQGVFSRNFDFRAKFFDVETTADFTGKV